MPHRYRKGQTALEYIVLLIIVMGALLGISNYFKRG
ncbi:MAG: class III signal peptide-containing protein, partial [Candidatus Omnitrophica bacterium]|nr:class III signal peptide-containing protein [Candidatus Omnitrophota bacterium]